MRRVGRVLVAVVVCLVWAHYLSLPASAQNPVVRVWPVETSTQVGQVVELAVQVRDISGMMGLDVRVVWDPELLELLDADEQVEGLQALPGDFPAPDYVVRNVSNPTVGTLRYAVSQTSDHPAVSGSGTAVTLYLHALAEGTTRVSFDIVKLVDAQGEVIEVDRASAEVRVEAGQGSSPTPSPTLGGDGYPAPVDEPTDTPRRTATPSPRVPRATPTPTEQAVAPAATLDAPSPSPTAEAVDQPLEPTPPPPEEQRQPEPTTQPAATSGASGPAARGQPAPVYPFIPSEWFVCLAGLLVLVTLLLFWYLSRRGQAGPGKPPRGLLR